MEEATGQPMTIESTNLGGDSSGQAPPTQTHSVKLLEVT